MAQLTPEQYETLKQRGLTDAKITALAKSRGLDLPNAPTGMAGFASGFVKGLIRDVARPTAQALQGAGQRAMAAVSPYSLEQVKSRYGAPSLDDSTPEGEGVTETLQADSAAERVGGVAANVASFFTPAARATKAAGTAVKGTGYLATKLGGIPISADEAPLVRLYRARTPLRERVAAILDDAPSGPTLNRETALKHNIWGTEAGIGVRATRAADRLWQGVISPSLKASKQQVHMPSFINEMREEIRLVPELSRRSDLDEALKAFAEDYGSVEKIPFEKLQKLKEGWAKFLPDKVYRGKPIAGSFREVQNIAAQLARNKIYAALGDDVKAAYFDYGNLRTLQELGEKALTDSKLKGGAGSFISGIKDMLLVPVATTGGLALYRAGKGLELVGAKGLKTVSQIFGQ